MKRTTGRQPRWLRRLIAVLGAAGLLGATLQAQAHLERDRATLESRVAAMRDAIHRVDDQRAAEEDDSTTNDERTQWFNWGNWNNWNNWPNWGNWNNWLNHR